MALKPLFQGKRGKEKEKGKDRKVIGGKALPEALRRGGTLKKRGKGKKCYWGGGLEGGYLSGDRGGGLRWGKGL